ncbi:MAG: sulfatase-like hydrolase/transferase [bacterium]
MNSRSERSRLQVVAISLFLVLVGLWLPFSHLYLLNTGNFTLPFSVHILPLLVLGAAYFGILYAVQYLGSRRVRTGISVGLLLIGILLWAEGTFLVGNFGAFQGGEPEWSNNRYLLGLELVLAAILLFLALRLRSRLLRHAGFITSLLSMVSLLNMYPDFMTDRKRAEPDIRHIFTEERIFQLSAEKNVLLFILDTFQTDAFAEILAEQPEWREVFAGFTYFPDAVSAYPKTYNSIPNLLCDVLYDNTKPYSTFLLDAYLGASAPKNLKQNGYDIRYSSFIWLPFVAHPEVADNIVTKASYDGRMWMAQNEFLTLYNLTLFRLAPSPAKPWVYNDNNFLVRVTLFLKSGAHGYYHPGEEDRVYSRGNDVWDLAQLDRLLAFLSADGEKPAFRLYHLNGSHMPFNLDRDLNHIGNQPITRETYRAQSEAMLALMHLVCERLRELGVYDNSLIFIIGDHGSADHDEVGLHEQAIQELGVDIDFSPADSVPSEVVIRSALPLVLVKPVDEQGPLKMSLAPVELSDIPNTIYAEMGLESALSGPSMFAIPAGAERRRVHLHYRFTNWEYDKMLPLTEYEITGFSWAGSSWRATGRDLSGSAVEITSESTGARRTAGWP